MKNIRCAPLPSVALLAGTMVALTAAPQIASAQAFGSYLRPGAPAQRSGAPAAAQTSPAQTAPVQSSAPQSAPTRTSPVFGRSGGSAANNSVPTQRIQSGPVVSIPEASSPWASSRSHYPQTIQPAPTVTQPVQAYPNQTYTNAYDGTPIQSSVSTIRRHRPSAPSGTSNSYSNSSAPPIGPGNGFFNNSAPPVGPGNGFFNNSAPPVGPGNGFPNRQTMRLTTPVGPQYVPPTTYQNNYIYSYTVNPVPVIAGGPPLLGGYYYGNYCDTPYARYTYPSVYSAYDNCPRYIFNSSPNVIVVGQPYYPVYATSYLPFFQPNYQVTYNENNYYVTNEDSARDLEAGGDQAREALQNAYPADSYQAAFADIARAWTDDDIKLLRKHIRDSDTRLSVFLNSKYSYSIASDDFIQITRDALDRLNTISFQFTRLRKAKNGDVTAFGKHVYRVAGHDDSGNGDTVPFDQTGPDPNASPSNQSDDLSGDTAKTVYVSYTLHHGNGQWYIIAVDSSDRNLVSIGEK